MLLLPAVVAADGAVAAEPFLPGSVPQAEFPKPAFKPKLDLSLGPGHLPSVQDIRPVPPVDARDAAERQAVQASAEKPLTFGFDVRTRHRVGDEIRADVAAPPSLGDQVRNTIDRSTFGVTGTYRF